MSTIGRLPTPGRLLTAAAFCFALLSYLTLAAKATANEGECPPWTGEGYSILKHTYDYYSLIDSEPTNLGIPLLTQSFYWDRGTWFRMPIGYRNPWPSLPIQLIASDLEAYKNWLSTSRYKGFDADSGKYREDLVSGEGIDGLFSFWMPSLRYIERNRRSVVGFRPCEAGRKPPGQDEYVVDFQIVWPFVQGSDDSSHARRFRVAAERLQNAGRLPQQELLGAEHSLNGAISGTKDYSIYSDDGDIAAMFYCIERWGTIAAPNPVCSGYIWQRSSDLILQMKFPADKGQRGTNQIWREPVMAAIQLVTDWRNYKE